MTGAPLLTDIARPPCPVRYAPLLKNGPQNIGVLGLPRVPVGIEQALGAADR